MSITTDIRGWFEGEILDTEKDLARYSHDASIFEVKPELVLAPKNTEDIKKVVRYISAKKKEHQTLSVSVRAAGTCMSGGSLNQSIILDVSRHINAIGEIKADTIAVEPGAYYRDMEKKTLAQNLILPSYTASKDICAVGGMVANNAGGEKSLVYGSTEGYVEELSVILSDGNEYTFKKLTEQEFKEKKSQQNFEGKIYRDISALIEANADLLKNAKPKVSKNSAGYLLWNVWDPTTKTFDLTRLFTGSQGTLGIITRITFRLVPLHTHKRLLAIPLDSLDSLPSTVAKVLEYNPESFESYDDQTFRLAEKYMPEVSNKVITKSDTPITLIAEFTGATDEEAFAKARDAQAALVDIGHNGVIPPKEEAENYWKIRRASFRLLREHTGGSHRVAPFIDDVILAPDNLPAFIPALKKILEKYRLTYTLAGHIGNGNFHLIPLVDMSNEATRALIIPLADEVFSLVFKLGGSMAGEHNDGIIRTPFLEKMYGKEICSLFAKTKNIFDPDNIFNPGKKVNGSLAYATDHFSKSNFSEQF